MMLEHAPPGYWLLKRTLDVVVSATAIVILAPVFAVLAAAIFLQDPSAPILFRQRRTGMGGRSFALLKFRTMVKDADRIKEELRHKSLVPWPDFRLENDPRVTRVGRFMRRTSLDEIPQFLNVLKGEMSLVGPRPTSFDVGTYDLWHTGRLDFRPGVTGPWQVWGRNTMDFDARCRLEISFFRRPTALKDLKVILATIASVFGRTGVA
ncbi:MAG TPA: sugar transferase [Solirubrobacteraceae bacterium]|nr:sugar transferase [Solirubrobacteraceae bacterium]